MRMVDFQWIPCRGFGVVVTLNVWELLDRPLHPAQNERGAAYTIITTHPANRL